MLQVRINIFLTKNKNFRINDKTLSLGNFYWSSHQGLAQRWAYFQYKSCYQSDTRRLKKEASSFAVLNKPYKFFQKKSRFCIVARKKSTYPCSSQQSELLAYRVSSSLQGCNSTGGPQLPWLLARSLLSHGFSSSLSAAWRLS